MTRFRFLGIGSALALCAACGGSSNIQSPASSGQGGTSGSSAGVSGNGGAPAAGGSAASSGGTSTGGMADGASGATGASGGSAGTGGPIGQIGVVGESCSPPGALACAGNHQKLTVACGGDGAWQVNQTCASGQFCNSNPGPDAGLCAEPPPECAGKVPGDRFCDGLEVLQCGADTLTIEPVEQCQYECADGACVGVECVPNMLVNCTDECGGPTANCYDVCSPSLAESDAPPLIDLSGIQVGETYTMQLPVVTVAECSCSHIDIKGVALRLPPPSEGLLWLVEVEPPWAVGVTQYGPGTSVTGNGCVFGFDASDACAVAGGAVETFVAFDATEPTTRSATATLRLLEAPAAFCD